SRACRSERGPMSRAPARASRTSRAARFTSTRARLIGAPGSPRSPCIISGCRTQHPSSRPRLPWMPIWQAPSPGTAEVMEAIIMSVRVEQQGFVSTVIIDRPERKNAVDGPTARALAETFRAVEADPATRAAVLWGAGGTFCAGAELKALGSEGSRVKPTGDGPMGPTRMLLSKPVIAAASGYAVAGGIELALWCALRVMEETATFGVFCRRWGGPLVDGGTIRPARLPGMPRA